MKTEAGYQPRYPELMEKYDAVSYFEKNRDRHEYRSYRICNAPECITKTKEEWRFIKSVGYVRQTRILMVRDERGEDITPDEETFRREGTIRQPGPTSGDKKKDDI